MKNIQIKIDSLKDLEKFNFMVIDNKVKKLNNNIQEILRSKNMSQGDLCRLTGISRQGISAIINNELVPSVVSSLQIAIALGMSVEEVFSLTPDAWTTFAKVNRDNTLYIDLYDMEIIDSTIKKEKIKKDNLEYIDVQNNISISASEYNKIKKNYFKSNSEIDKSLLSENFDKLYDCRYKKLIQTIKIPN